MFEWVRGRVMEQSEGLLIFEVGFVALQLHFLARAGKLTVGREIQLFVHLVVREDNLSLFAFQQREELYLFRELLGISGVGPRLAQAIVAYVRPQDLREAIERNNPSALMGVPGVGKKTASKIVFSLQGKTLILPNEQWPEALQALLALGFSEKEARERLAKINLSDPGITSEDVIRMALKG